MLIMLTVIAVLIKLIAFFRESLIAFYYGTAYITDCYVLATSMPAIFFGCLNAVAVGFVPLYTQKRNFGKEEGDRFTSNIISWTVIISLGSLIVLEGFLPGFLGLLTRNFTLEAKILAEKFLRISLCVILIQPVFQIFSSYMDCNERFIFTNICSMCISLFQIVFIIASNRFGNVWLAAGYVCSEFGAFCMLLFFAFFFGFKYDVILKYDENVRKIAFIIVPIFFSNTIVQFNQFIDKFFASSLPEGSISALNYANTTKNLIYALVTAAIVTVTYPRIASKFAGKDISGAKKMIFQSLNILIILLVPITFGAFLFSREIIAFIYEQGNFDFRATELTAGAFRMYTMGILFISIREVVVRVFYSLELPSIPMKVSLISVALNIFLNSLWIEKKGIIGLSLATALCSLVSAGILLVVLVKKIGGWGIKKQGVIFMKSLCSSLIMIIILKISCPHEGGFGSKVRLLQYIFKVMLLGGGVYFICMAMLNIKYLREIWNRKIKKD